LHAFTGNKVIGTEYQEEKKLLDRLLEKEFGNSRKNIIFFFMGALL